MELSKEQNLFIDKALEGNNILVDACIGSGKTTAIQALCDLLPENKKILYLTYNKLLKVDAKNKIKNKNVFVTNYHGFAYRYMCMSGLRSSGKSDLIQSFIYHRPYIHSYDVLIIDEYQDIEEELSTLLWYIKETNPNMQIIAVGDMRQKIYDKTTLDVQAFIEEFLDCFEELEFTQCFRLSADLASTLGRIWNKNIVGVNNNCNVQVMDYNDITDYLATKTINDILCLGSRNGDMIQILNKLELHYPDKFNKKTVYASIQEQDGKIEPNGNCAIFTTYDSSKGLEKPICVVFDFTETYWNLRNSKTMTKYEILRNIFCVAASRGKQEIIFVKKNEPILNECILSTPTKSNMDLEDVNISTMFDFKYKEDIEECFKLLDTELVQECENIINIKDYDDLIDLSPCIGMYQESMYFNNYSIDKQIELIQQTSSSRTLLVPKHWSVEKKILAITAFETQQRRYIHQVYPPFIENQHKIDISNRLSTILDKDEDVQQKCKIVFRNNDGYISFVARGRCDVIKNNEVYELKFVNSLSHEHFLQCACYLVGLNLDTGYLWNVKTNEMHKISIPNKKLFLDAVAKTITKRLFKKYN